MAKTFNVKIPEIAPNRLVVRHIAQAKDEKPEKYNILTFAAHERYQSQLAKTGHNFYLFETEGIKLLIVEYNISLEILTSSSTAFLEA